MVFTGIEPGHRSRIYVQNVEGGVPRAISPEGVTGSILTADGKFVFGFSDAVALYPVEGKGAPKPVPGLRPDETIGGVASDGRSIMVVQQPDPFALAVSRLDLTTGRRELVKNIAPADAAGVFQINVLSSRPTTNGMPTRLTAF